jgi:hypothetical protein
MTAWCRCRNAHGWDEPAQLVSTWWTRVRVATHEVDRQLVPIQDELESKAIIASYCQFY